MSSLTGRNKRPPGGNTILRWSRSRPSKEAKQNRKSPPSLRQAKRVAFENYNLSPLAQAKEIQDEGNSSRDRRDHPKRENHKRPAPISKPFSPSTLISEPGFAHRDRSNNKKYCKSHLSNKISTACGKTFQEDNTPTTTRKRTESKMVDLCCSDSDTDVGSDRETTIERSLSSLSQKAQKTKKHDVAHEHKGNAKLRKRIRQYPGYPSMDKSVSSDIIQSQEDDEDDSIKTQNLNGDDYGVNNNKNKKKLGKTPQKSEICPQSLFDESEKKLPEKKGKSVEFEANAKPCISNTMEWNKKKKAQRDFSIHIPVLKSTLPSAMKRRRMNTSKEKKSKLPKNHRHYDDVKDMGDGSHLDYDNDNDANTTCYTDMKKLIEQIDNGTAECNDNKDQTTISSPRTIAAPSHSNGNTSFLTAGPIRASSKSFKNMKFIEEVDNGTAECNDNKDQIMISSPRTFAAPSHSNDNTSFLTAGYVQASSRTLKNMKKVNSKGLRAKTKGRKSSKIIPGSSLNRKTNRQQQSEEKLRWHPSKKEAQDDDATNWDPYNGGSYRSTRSSAARLSNDKRPGTDRLEVESSPQRRYRRNKQKTPETIDILSSDSEDEDILVAEEDCDVLKYYIKRLAVDKKVYNNHDHQPLIIFHTEKSVMEISFFKSKVVRKNRERIHIETADVDEILFSETDDAVGLDVDLDSFISFTGDVTMKSMKRRKQEFTKRSQQFLLEFEDDQHMQDIIAAAGDSTSIRTIPVPPDDLDDVATPLITDSKKKYKLRSRVTPHKIDPFISNKRGDEILVVYPFGVDKNKIEVAADGLNELSWSETSKREDQDSVESKNDNSLESSKFGIINESSENVSTTLQNSQRSHFIEIRAEDYEKLDSGQWLNDSLVDMWMQWISRNIICKRSSNCHFFTSHFYTTLASEGVMGVTSWTAKKNINIFEKRLVFIPINKTLHWSLCVVVNPGAIIPSLDDDDDDDLKDRLLPCMLFFDSLNMHRKGRVHKDVVKWLNSEWKRMKDPNQEPFSRNSCKMYDPQVPRQNNGSDCGVFVCRYAFAMFQLRHLKFSHKDAGLDKIRKERSPAVQRQRHAFRSRAFSDLITNGKEFDFNVDDIQRIRIEFKTLIRNLHPMYQTVKDGRIKAEKEEKLARKRRKGLEKATKTTENAMLKSAGSVGNKSFDTHSAMAASNADEAECTPLNDSSDSSKENRIPRVEQEKPPVLKMQISNDDERVDEYDPLTSEGTTQQQRSLEVFGMEDQLGQSALRENALYVDREEMANNDDIVHL